VGAFAINPIHVNYLAGDYVASIDNMGRPDVSYPSWSSIWPYLRNHLIEVEGFKPAEAEAQEVEVRTEIIETGGDS